FTYCTRRPTRSTVFPFTTLFRSKQCVALVEDGDEWVQPQFSAPSEMGVDLSAVRYVLDRQIADDILAPVHLLFQRAQCVERRPAVLIVVTGHVPVAHRPDRVEVPAALQFIDPHLTVRV